MRMSASRLRKWQACSLQAHFAEVLDVPDKQNAKATFGTIIHSCLEDFNNGIAIETCIDKFKYQWEHPETIGATPDYWPRMTTYAGLRNRGIEILVGYADKMKWETREVLAQEHKFLVPFGEHQLSGIVDHLEFKLAGNGRKTLRVCDFKTASKKPTKIELLFDLQFTIYIYAAQQKEFWLGNGPDYPAIENGEELWKKVQKMKPKGVWVHLWDMKEIDVGARDDEDFYRLYQLLNQIERAQEAEVFVPKIGEACLWCPFTEPCGITLPESNDINDSIEI